MTASPPVLQIGPAGIRMLGGAVAGPVFAELAEAALAGIDDPVVLLGDRPVWVDDLWRSLIASVPGGRPVVLVHPSHWPPSRLDRVRAAAGDSVVAVSRREWLEQRSQLSQPGQPSRAPAAPERRGRPFRTPAGVIAGGIAAVCVAVAAAVLPGGQPRPAAAGDPAGPMAEDPAGLDLVVEGRVAVGVPPRWTARRITGGPGSPRVQVTSPEDPAIAVHITQSFTPGTTLADAAASLRTAIAGQPPGIFVDFNPQATAAGRPAVTYRELRPGRVIGWSVLLVGSTRISVGCQSRPGAEDGVRRACEQAIRSAREIPGTGIR